MTDPEVTDLRIYYFYCYFQK